MCPSSGEITVFRLHFVPVILYGSLSGVDISFLYTFRATMCPSSGEITVFIPHLVFLILYG